MTWYHHKFLSNPVTSSIGQRIYLITMDKESQYWHTLNQGVKDMADIIGISYIWAAPEERDVDEQIKIFQEAVDSGASVILLAASDPVKISNAVKEAKEKGVKIIYVDSPAVEPAIVTLATENYTAGMIAGHRMILELDEMSIKEGSIGIISVTPENTTTINREKGFRDVITLDGRYQVLDTIYTDGDIESSQEAAIKLINLKNDLVGLFGTNEGATIGVGNAIRDTNQKIIGVGFDYTPQIQELLRNQSLDSVLVQNPYTMGYLGMAEAVAALSGHNTGPSYINTGVSIITKFQPRPAQ